METKIIKVLYDNSGNKAVIENGMTLPYKDARKEEEFYRLSLYSTYDNNFLYHVSVYDTPERLENALSKYSGGNWHEA